LSWPSCIVSFWSAASFSHLRAERSEFLLALLPSHAVDLLEELHGVRDPFRQVLLQLFFLVLGQVQVLLHLVAEHQEGPSQVLRQVFAYLLGNLRLVRSDGFRSRDRFADNAIADAAVEIDEDGMAPRQAAQFLVLVRPL
jgi:hypothetical protein